MQWFRFYHEFVDDPKIAMMTDSDQLLWVKALCLASANDKHRGVIELADEEIGWKLRVTVESWKHAVDKFRAKGMLEHCDQGYRIVNWDKRQFSTDNSNDRVKKYREKLKHLPGGSYAYQKHREEILERDGHKCVYCGSPEKLVIDHIFPISKGGDHDINNLATACRKCNAGKSGRTPKEAGYLISHSSTSAAFEKWLNQNKKTEIPSHDVPHGVTVTVTPSDTDPESDPETEPDPKSESLCSNPEGGGAAKKRRPVLDKFAAQFEQYPWKPNGRLDEKFCGYVGKAISFDSKSETMPPVQKGRGHILNLLKTGIPEDFEKLEGYWDDYQESLRTATTPAQAAAGIAELAKQAIAREMAS